MQNPVLIHTTPQPAPAAGLLLVSYNWRSTKERTVPESQKHRACVITASYILTPEVQAVQPALRTLLVDAIETIAAARLADFCQASNMAATTVSADIFKLDALLAWNADRVALQQRLTADEVREFCKTSATISSARVLYGDTVADALASQLAKLAGPNHGLTPEKAGNMLTRLWKEDDAASTTGLRIMLKLQSIHESSSAADALADILG